MRTSIASTGPLVTSAGASLVLVTSVAMLAPALVHLATNSGGVFVAWYVLSSA